MTNVENAAENALQAALQIARQERDAYKEVVPPTDQIRLLIIGRTGVGKSTIISRVFGVSEEDVSKISWETMRFANII